ncbi:hypothetical protein BJ742DRAFT_832441 [Cladochytrium replicatum]|nr:hypothetical protein BJ742DRAFT_832441 [Cladochytrium replicatum]
MKISNPIPSIIDRIKWPHSFEIGTRSVRPRSGNDHRSDIEPPSLPPAEPADPTSTTFVTNEEIFEKYLHPARYHKYICAIDFGTSGVGFAYGASRREGNLDPKHDVHARNDLTKGGKSPTAILFDAHDEAFKAFGKDALTTYSEFPEEELDAVLLFKDFKMELFNGPVGPEKRLWDTRKRKQMLAYRVIGEILKQVKTAFLRAVRMTETVLDGDVLWVVTIPAIWGESAKQLMKRACMDAKLGKDDSIMLALEPEAASIFCLRSTTTNASSGTYMVVDCGGGTVDITVHQPDNMSLKDVQPASGGDWGSTAINRAFEQLLCLLFGNTKVEEVRLHKAYDYMLMLNIFEEKKRAFNGENDSSINLGYTGFTSNLDAVVHAYNKEHQHHLDNVGNRLLVVKRDAMRALFKPVITKIVKHVKEVIEKVPSLKTVLLVGGFADSDVLRATMTAACASIGVEVRSPEDASLCVLKGAVLYGNNPSLIKERIARLSYGTSLMTRDVKEHDPTRVTLVNGHPMVHAMQWFVRIGESIPFGRPVSRPLYPTKPDQRVICSEIFEGREPDIRYPDDQGVSLLGTINSPECNPEKLRRSGIKLHMLFTGGQIVVISENPDGGNEVVKITISES